MFLNKIRLGLCGLALTMSTGIATADTSIYTFTNPEIRIHDIQNGIEVGQTAATTNYVYHTYASPFDNRLYVVDAYYTANVGTQVQMSVIDTAQGTEIQRADIDMFANINPDLIVTSEDGSIWAFGNRSSNNIYTPLTIFDINTMSIVKQISVNFSTSQIKMAPDGSRLYTHTRTGGFGDSTLRVFDVESGLMINEVSFSRQHITLQAIHPSGNYLYLSYDGNGLRLIDVNTLQVLPETLLPNSHGEFLAKGDVLIQANVGKVNIYNIDDYSLRGDFPYGSLGMNAIDSFDYELTTNKIAFVGMIPKPDYSGLLQVLSVIDAGTATLDYVKTFEENTDLWGSHVEIVADAVNLGLTLQKVNASVIKCINNTTGQEVVITPQSGEMSWDCEAGGLLVNSGDTVTIGGMGVIP